MIPAIAAVRPLEETHGDRTSPRRASSTAPCSERSPIARPTTGTTPARSTSSRTRSPAAPPARRRTRASSSRSCARSGRTGSRGSRELAAANPSWTETDLTWAVIEEMAVRGAGVLEPVFVRERGRKGRLSLQTNPANYPNAERMLEQGVRFATLAPNMQVKFPATRAGHPGDRGRRPPPASASTPRSASRCPRRSRSREAVERGLDALAARGGDVTAVTPVCTIMVGRLDDWMRVLVERDEIAVHPDALNWAGIAAFKRAYRPSGERGYRTRLLAAAYRHRLHWTELVGGDVILTIPHAWQVRFNASGIAPEARIDEPVDPNDRPGAARADPRLRAGLRARTASRSTSSTASARPSGPCAASSGPTTTSSEPSATSCSPTRTSARPEPRNVGGLRAASLGPSVGRIGAVWPFAADADPADIPGTRISISAHLGAETREKPSWRSIRTCSARSSSGTSSSPTASSTCRRTSARRTPTARSASATSTTTANIAKGGTGFVIVGRHDARHEDRPADGHLPRRRRRQLRPRPRPPGRGDAPLRREVRRPAPAPRPPVRDPALQHAGRDGPGPEAARGPRATRSSTRTPRRRARRSARRRSPRSSSSSTCSARRPGGSSRPASTRSSCTPRTATCCPSS